MCIVDLHNHIVTEEVVAFLAREGARLDTRIVETREGRFARIGEAAVRPLHARMCDPAARIADMDRLGIDVQAVSCTPFVLYADAPADVALAVAQANNDSLAAVARAHARPLRAARLGAAPGARARGARARARRGARAARRRDPRARGRARARRSAPRAVLVRRGSARAAGLHPSVRRVAARRIRALCALAAGREPVRHGPRRGAARARAACSSAIPRLRSCSITAAERFPRCSRGSRRATS